MESVVVFPAPFGPTTPKKDPARTVSEISSTARVSSKCLESPEIVRTTSLPSVSATGVSFFAATVVFAVAAGRFAAAARAEGTAPLFVGGFVGGVFFTRAVFGELLFAGALCAADVSELVAVRATDAAAAWAPTPSCRFCGGFAGVVRAPVARGVAGFFAAAARGAVVLGAALFRAGVFGAAVFLAGVFFAATASGSVTEPAEAEDRAAGFVRAGGFAAGVARAEGF